MIVGLAVHPGSQLQGRVRFIADAGVVKVIRDVIDFLTFAVRRRGTGLEYLRILPGVVHPHFSAVVRVQVHLQVITPPPTFPHVIGLAARVVQPSTDFS